MGSFSNDSNERRGASRKRRSLALMAREAPIARREPGAAVTEGSRRRAGSGCGRDGERVQLLADCGERDLVEEEPRGVGRSAAAPGTAGRTGRDCGQAEGAARRLTNMPMCGRCGTRKSMRCPAYNLRAVGGYGAGVLPASAAPVPGPAAVSGVPPGACAGCQVTVRCSRRPNLTRELSPS